ncbi:hypothetical protein F4774DRAFT_428462 [Daldinia eschscholtzii]|nr:hypothetical protein F4774DRAFT_428462 [Daldinia eschscholtzii]
MSAFEVAGLVLGAFSGAIEACKIFREAYRRVQIARRIRIEYTDCEQSLKYYQTALIGRLRRLLLPLARDGIEISHLLSDPTGDIWKDRTVADRIECRFGKEKYDLFTGHIQKYYEVIEVLKGILKLDSASLHDYLTNQNFSTVPYLSKEWINAQIYTVSFCNGEASRRELFGELEQLHVRLGELFDNDIETEYEQLLTNNSEMCNFWLNADAFFKGIASVWEECCKKDHLARLVLQHRTNHDNDFKMLFTRITQTRRKIERPNTTSIARKPRISFVYANLISCICNSLKDDNSKCYGYLTSENGTYYVYNESQHQGDNLKSMTIDQVLRGGPALTPSRRQRYILSLTLASSFVQLYETPWLPKSWKKSDIIFFSDGNSNVPLLDYPCLDRELAITAQAKGKQRQQKSLPRPTINNGVEQVYRSLELLGIILLELCFGQLLEEQKFRQDYQLPGLTEMQKCALDAAAARQWNSKVTEEAGSDFDEAVRWCLDGCRITPPEDLRREMLKRVVLPLERCYNYLTMRV